MTLKEFQSVLTECPNAPIQWMLPDGAFIPAHFHVTEVGRVHKDFIDCGGTVRSATSCVLQVWVADDKDHRLSSAKLTKILGLAAPLLGPEDLPVEVEYEAGVLSQYPLTSCELTNSGLVFHLGGKHTACLAEDRCGLNLAEPSCCGTSGCC